MANLGKQESFILLDKQRWSRRNVFSRIHNECLSHRNSRSRKEAELGRAVNFLKSSTYVCDYKFKIAMVWAKYIFMKNNDQKM